jgi:hypothetical protein
MMALEKWRRNRKEDDDDENNCRDEMETIAVRGGVDDDVVVVVCMAIQKALVVLPNMGKSSASSDSDDRTEVMQNKNGKRVQVLLLLQRVGLTVRRENYQRDDFELQSLSSYSVVVDLRRRDCV